MPLLILSGLQESGEMDINTLGQMLEAGKITKDQMMEQEKAMKEQMGDMSDSIIRQKAVMAVKGEYEALGWNLGDYQMKYLFVTGGKMLGITVVMMGAAILAGLIASYTSASVGMKLRSRIFKKVVSFSHSEMDQFSTASLITRSTNDIQQIQMVCVMLLRMVLYAPIIGIGGVIKVIGTKTGMGWVIGVAVGTIMAVVFILMRIAMPKFKKMQVLVDNMNLVSRKS